MDSAESTAHCQEPGVDILLLELLGPATGPPSLMNVISASSASTNQPWPPNPWPKFQGGIQMAAHQQAELGIISTQAQSFTPA